MSILIIKPAGARGMGSWLDAPQQQLWRATLHAGQQHALEVGQLAHRVVHMRDGKIMN